jgi:hypothetical protein
MEARLFELAGTEKSEYRDEPSLMVMISPLEGLQYRYGWDPSVVFNDFDEFCEHIQNL